MLKVPRILLTAVPFGLRRLQHHFRHYILGLHFLQQHKFARAEEAASDFQMSRSAIA